MNTKFIIQARTGSSRLPGKTVRPFFEGKGIFRVISENLLACINPEDLVLATTLKSSDDELAKIAAELGIPVYRGDENDVLLRFICAAREFNADIIVRICADNPFLLPGFITDLLDEFNKKPCDYLSFKTGDGSPVIQSHWGLFAEVTTLSALEKVNRETNESLFHEHVTNYIYSNPAKFDVRLIGLPEVFSGRENYRFTLDTSDDFELLGKMYSDLNGKYGTTIFTPEQLFEYIDKDQNLKNKMLEQIERNAK